MAGLIAAAMVAAVSIICETTISLRNSFTRKERRASSTVGAQFINNLPSPTPQGFQVLIPARNPQQDAVRTMESDLADPSDSPTLHASPAAHSWSPFTTQGSAASTPGTAASTTAGRSLGAPESVQTTASGWIDIAYSVQDSPETAASSLTSTLNVQPTAAKSLNRANIQQETEVGWLGSPCDVQQAAPGTDSLTSIRSVQPTAAGSHDTSHSASDTMAVRSDTASSNAAIQPQGYHDRLWLYSLSFATNRTSDSAYSRVSSSCSTASRKSGMPIAARDSLLDADYVASGLQAMKALSNQAYTHARLRSQATHDVTDVCGTYYQAVPASCAPPPLFNPYPSALQDTKLMTFTPAQSDITERFSLCNLDEERFRQQLPCLDVVSALDSYWHYNEL